MPARSLSSAEFDRMYEAATDPWHLQDNQYEVAKYRDTLDALAGRRFGRAFEVGCSIGLLTMSLANHVDELLAVDIAAKAVALAGERCRQLAHVTVRQMQVPQAWPPGQFDLIVFSEVLYYLGDNGTRRASVAAAASLAPGGCVLLVNWTGPSDLPMSGEEAAAAFIDMPGKSWRVIEARRRESYRLDLLESE